MTELELYEKSIGYEMLKLNIIQAICSLQGEEKLRYFLKKYSGKKIGLYGGGVVAKVLSQAIWPVKVSIIDTKSRTGFFKQQEIRMIDAIEPNEFDVIIITVLKDLNEITGKLMSIGFENVIFLKDILVTKISMELAQ